MDNDDGEVGQAKPWANSCTNSTKSKTTVWPNFLAKFKLFTKPSSRAGFSSPKTRLAFLELRQALIKVLILHYFNLKYYDWVETDVLGNAISKVLSLQMLDNLNQWYQVAFSFRKVILAETQYKSYKSKHLAIVEVFKTWHYYLEGFKHKVLIHTDHNNLYRSMDIKNLNIE